VIRSSAQLFPFSSICYLLFYFFSSFKSPIHQIQQGPTTLWCVAADRMDCKICCCASRLAVQSSMLHNCLEWFNLSSVRVIWIGSVYHNCLAGVCHYYIKDKGLVFTSGRSFLMSCAFASIGKPPGARHVACLASRCASFWIWVQSICPFKTV